VFFLKIYRKVFNFFLFLILCLNLKNKSYFLMPIIGMPMVSAICLAGEVLGSKLFVLDIFQFNKVLLELETLILKKLCQN